MKKIALTLTLVLSFSLLYSQYKVTGNGSSIDMARNMQTKSKLNNYTQNNVSKSKLNYFLDDEWMGGVMFTKDSASVNGYTYRYNIYTDQVELKSLVDPSTINVLSIGRKKFVHSEFFRLDSTIDAGYFELIADGECKLLLRRSVKYAQTTRDIEGYGANESTSINENLYIKKGNEPALEIEKSKDFLKPFFSDKEQALDYLNNKTILIMTEKKLIDLVKYYNKI